MKLLFDENVSPRLPELLRREFPESAHVRDVGLLGDDDDDDAVWNHVRAHGLAIVSKDNDFRQRSFVEGAPPKIVWLNVGNAGTLAIAALLRKEQGRIEAFAIETEGCLLVLSSASDAY